MAVKWIKTLKELKNWNLFLGNRFIKQHYSKYGKFKKFTILFIELNSLHLLTKNLLSSRVSVFYPLRHLRMLTSAFSEFHIPFSVSLPSFLIIASSQSPLQALFSPQVFILVPLHTVGAQ